MDDIFKPTQRSIDMLTVMQHAVGEASMKLFNEHDASIQEIVQAIGANTGRLIAFAATEDGYSLAKLLTHAQSAMVASVMSFMLDSGDENAENFAIQIAGGAGIPPERLDAIRAEAKGKAAE